MRNERNASRKSWGKKERESLPTEERLRLEGKEKLGAAIALLKKWTNATRPELMEVKLTEKKLERKSWGKEPLAVLREKTTVQWETVTKLDGLWADAMDMQKDATITAEKLTEMEKKITDECEVAAIAYKDYKKKDLGEFIRLGN